MRNAPALFALVFLFAACGEQSVVAPAPDSAPLFAAAQSIQDRYIVVFRSDVSNADALTDQLVRGNGGQEHYRYRHALQGFAATLPVQALEGIRRNPNVAYVEADGVMEIVATQTSATWGLDRIDQRALPLSTTYTYDVNGSGVRAYIIDTGIRTSHSDFGSRTGAGFTAIADGGGTQDCNGHGTHVAGTVGGSVYGVAKGVVLYPVRVLGCNGSGSTSGVIAGVDWVTAQTYRPAVANMSLGGGASTALDNAVANSINSGVTYAVSAGNSNANACNYSPARVGPALTTGSTTSSDARSSFSNFGTCVDLFAPGSSIVSAWHTSNTAINTLSGTSMASPHVAGVAALYLSIPGNGVASAATVKQAILAVATAGVVGGAGTGSPNLLLHSLFAGGGGPTNTPPVASFTFGCANLDCSFNGAGSSDSDGTISSYAWTFGDGSTGSGVNPTKTYASAGTYTVTLTVTDNQGATGGQTQSVTVTPPPGSSLVVHIGDWGSSTSTSGPNWRAYVTATVHDAAGSPVAGASVAGSWTPGGGGSCVTGSDGTCTVSSSMFKSKVSSTLFNVSGISGADMTYNASANTASEITVSKP